MKSIILRVIFHPIFFMSTAYADLVNVSGFWKKRENNFNPDRWNVAFYCRDCKEMVEAIRLEPQKVGKKMKEYLFECPKCHGQSIAIGTEEGLKEHYGRK